MCPHFAPWPGPGVLFEADPCPLPSGARRVLGDGPAAAPAVVARGDRAGRLERGLRRAARLALAACAIRATSLGRAGCPCAQKRTVARDLVASVQRFNVRWRQFLGSLNLGPANEVIDQYNKYYVFEKECVMGSARLASRHFTPVPQLSPEVLLRDYPMLPVPELLAL